MDHDNSTEFAVPPNHQLAVLYRTLKNTHTLVSTSLGGDVSSWFATVLETLRNSHSDALEALCTTFDTILRIMEPYFRAVEVTYDTYHIFSNDDDDGAWDARALALTEDIRSWRARLQGLLAAYDIGIRHMKRMIDADEL